VNLDPGQLAALSAAVSEGTFEAAARALHVTPSAISQRVKALEVTLGRVLVTRTKPVQPTESGQAVLRLARQIQVLTADVLGELSPEAGVATGRATIGLAANADSLATWLPAALASAGTGFVFDLHRADQERTTELLRQGVVMAAVTSSAEPVAGCSVRRLGRMSYRPVASADFAARWFAGGVSADGLAVAPVVVFDRDDRLQDGYLRKRTRRRIEPPRHHLPDSAAFVDAVALGMGWGMLPDQQSAAGLRAGDLVRIDPDYASVVTLYWQQWRLGSAPLNTLAGAVLAFAATALNPLGSHQGRRLGRLGPG
jgi:LysR family transcriptional regulator, chromosome initiation inhibitor